jgi:hypothetical protein
VVLCHVLSGSRRRYEEEEEELTIADQAVVTKYKGAAEFANSIDLRSYEGRHRLSPKVRPPRRSPTTSWSLRALSLRAV